jgi:hypothetical protein
MPTVDGLLGRIQQLARQVGVLEGRQRALEGEVTAGGGKTTALGEMQAAHGEKSKELDASVMALRNIREIVTRSGGADSREIHDRLLEALQEGRTRLRQVEGEAVV